MHNVIESVLGSIPRRQPAKQHFLTSLEIRPLARGELISFQVLGKPLVRLTCLEGMLWITCEDDFEDYVLTSGQSFIPRTRGQMVIHALTSAQVKREVVAPK